jgi:DNA (cytosine-5)-methyltransferase 1
VEIWEEMNHASLFSGIGGFDLAAQWMGWNNAFHCEWNEFGQKVLKYYWPNAISYGDITKTDFNIWRGRIDILTGGFPCQPYSTAGKRLGKEDDRHLWPEMLRAIREIQPTWIVGENVRGLVSWNGGMVFNEVQADLENEGYEVTPFLLPACAVNAPHRRDRVWFVAYSVDNRHQTGRKQVTKENGIQGVDRQEMGSREFDRTNISPITSHTKSESSQRMRLEQREISKQEQGKFGGNGGGMGCERDVADTCNKGLQGGKINRSTGSSGENIYKQPTGHIPPTWQEFPTQSPVCNGDDGIFSRLDGITFPKWRNESIKAGGNAIVPQVACQIFKAIDAYNTSIF